MPARSARSARSANQASNQGKRFECPSSPAACAGLLGVPDVNSLKAVIQSQAFQSIYKQYDAKRKAPWNLHQVKIPKVFDLIEHQATRKGYGTAGALQATEKWTANDWVGHYIVSFLQITYPAPAPKWGPLPGEKNLEAWNRVWQLVRLTNWTNTPSTKPKFWRTQYPNQAAKIPEFMKGTSTHAKPGSVLLNEIPYEEYDWQLRWDNFAVVDARITTEIDNGTRKDVPQRRSKQSKMPDPRRWDAEDWRDKIRREWDMKRLSLDIDTLVMEVTNDENPEFWNCFEDYTNIQAICRGGEVDKGNIRFVLRTKFVDADSEIYERTIPVGLDEFYTEALNGVVRQRTALDDELIENEDEGFVAADPELQPDDFYGPEENPLDFDPKDPANGNLVADDILSGEQLKEFADFMRAKGAEQHIGPDFLVACDNLGFDPASKEPQLPGTARTLKPVQVTGLAWMVAQCHGGIPRVPEFQHQVPAYRRVAMRGGLIGDDMGIGKTIQTLGFITWMSENYASFGAGTPIPPHQNIQPEGEGEFRPSLVIAPTSVAYQWVEETEEFWKGLKVYLYHGRNDGHLGAKYKHLRILAEELKGYAGNATKDPIRADLKPLFDKKNQGNLKVVVVAAYDAFRERAKLVEQDEDEIELISSRFSGVFGHMFCDEGHAMRNPLAKKFKVIKGNDCHSQWLLTGTPLLNRETDLIGLSTFLWHEDLKRPLSAARLAEVQDMEFDVFDQTLTSRDPEIRFRAHPDRIRQIFQKKDAAGNPDLVHQKQRLPMVMDLLLLRRALATQIPAGPNNFVRAGTSIPPYQNRTIVLDTPPKHAAERQLATVVYVNDFLRGMKGASIPKTGAPVTSGSKNAWRYPSKWLRRLSLVSTSLTIDRLVKRQELNGMTVLAGDILEWRARGVDYRWIADKVRTRGDPVLNSKKDYLLFLATLNEKLKYICWFIKEMHLKGPGKDRKLCIVFEWPVAGLELEKVFEALYLKVAVIHAGTAEAERIAIREAFCNREDKSIQFLLISYRTSGFGLNFHADCHSMVLYEQAININSELQAICRVFRVGQKHGVFVTRLISKNAIDGHRNFKQGEKMLSEVVGWSSGAIAERLMANLLVKAGVRPDAIDFENPEILRRASWAVIGQLRGSDEEDVSSPTPHIRYYALSKRTLALAEIADSPEEEARRKK